MEIIEAYKGFVLREVKEFIVRREICVVLTKNGPFDEKQLKEKYNNTILGLKELNYGTVNYGFVSAPSTGLIVILNLDKQWMDEPEYVKEVFRVGFYKALQDRDISYRLTIDTEERGMTERLWDVYKEVCDNIDFLLSK
jgi:hypothetical protein